MTSLIRRLLMCLLLISLVATACGSSGDDADDAGDAAATDAAADDTLALDDTDDGDDTVDPAATSIPVPDDGAADSAIAGLDADPADAVPADPTTTAQGFVRNLFNIDPEPAMLECMVAESADNEVLDTALRTTNVAFGEVDDPQMQALTEAMNGCLSTISLADWATQAIGPRGDVKQSAPPCFVERFDDPADGDITFYNFVALTYQFRLDPGGIDGLVDALTTCTPITSLTDFFASQTEQASSFAILVDRECLGAALSPDEVSLDFWTVFVDGITPPVDFIEPFIDECSSVADGDLAAEVPADFVPWSGVGTLAAVRPSARVSVYTAAPPMTIDQTKTYEAVFATGGGEIRIRLFADTAPITVNSFVSLARDGYYDGTTFHRVIEGFMAQGGDPTGSGMGGPGYQFEDEIVDGPPIDRKGLLAMANVGPDTNGSQFFLTFAEADSLTGAHTVFGEVIEGIEIVDAIERRNPDAPNGRGQLLESVTILES